MEALAIGAPFGVALAGCLGSTALANVKGDVPKHIHMSILVEARLVVFVRTRCYAQIVDAFLGTKDRKRRYAGIMEDP